MTSNDKNPPAAQEQEGPADDNKIIAERRDKLARLREQGVAFPNDFLRDTTALKLDELYGSKTREELEELPVEVAQAGEIGRLGIDGLHGGLGGGSGRSGGAS